MNIERKLEYFTKIIDKEVESRKYETRIQMGTDIESRLAQAEAQAKVEADAGYEAQTGAITKIMNKRITEAETTSRRSLSHLQERLTAQLFDYIKDDIISFTKSADYGLYLISSIQAIQAASRHEFRYVQLAPADIHLSEAIESATGLIAEEGDEANLGGFKLLSQSRGISQDHTLQARLTKARQEFAQEIMPHVIMQNIPHTSDLITDSTSDLITGSITDSTSGSIAKEEI